jgi:small subunit ribosomal protein S9
MVTKKKETSEISKAQAHRVVKTAVYTAIGRRKSAVAQVKMQTGRGQVSVNKKKGQEYFTGWSQRKALEQPLDATGLRDRMDLAINVRGGGLQAQSEACRLGIARAIVLFHREHRPALKAAGHLRRDAREKERKKYGLKRARRAPQFSKR